MNKNSLEGKRKREILNAAAIIFSKKGYWKTDMESIANLAKIGKGTIYRYFKNKEDLFFSLLDRALDELFEKLNTGLVAVRKKDICGKTEKIVSIYLGFFEERFRYFNIITEEYPGLRLKAREKFWKKFIEGFNQIGRIFKDGISENIIEEYKSDDMVFLLIGMMHGAIQQWVLHGRKYSLKDKTAVISKIFLKGVVKNER
jgi:AcrR family transcriptional regulator